MLQTIIEKTDETLKAETHAEMNAKKEPNMDTFDTLEGRELSAIIFNKKLKNKYIIKKPLRCQQG